MLVKRQRMHYMSSVDVCVCVISAFELALSHMWQSNSFCLFNTINNLPLSFWTVCDVFILLKAKPQYCWGVCVCVYHWQAPLILVSKRTERLITLLAVLFTCCSVIFGLHSWWMIISECEDWLWSASAGTVRDAVDQSRSLKSCGSRESLTAGVGGGTLSSFK